MLNLIKNGEKFTCDSLEEARELAHGELNFWRETLEACVGDDNLWNDFINELWQSGGADEAVRLHALFKERKSRRWFPMALVLADPNDGDLWRAIVDAQSGDGRALGAWLKAHRNTGMGSVASAFRDDSTLWQSISTAQTGDEKPLLAWIAAHRSSRSVADQKSFDLEIAKWSVVKKPVVQTTVSKFLPGQEKTITLPGGVPMTFCWCPATTSEEWKKISGGKDYFLMGSPADEIGREDDELQHRVTLTRGFWMGKYPVTQTQWKSVMGPNPSKFKGEDRPVESVSWNDCKSFISKVNGASECKVVLPTEAQWEYACRAGTTTPFSFGSVLNGDRANCDGTKPYGNITEGRYRQETSTVGSYMPNAWGLCDMHGNVYEWCADWYGGYGGNTIDPIGPASGTYRVSRGCCWRGGARGCRSAYRKKDTPDIGDVIDGFRLVCTAGLND